MPKLKILSGEDLVKVFESFGFVVESQKGTHVKLKRISGDNSKQILVVPLHKELDKGTTKAIFNQSLKYISAEELSKHFYG